MTPLPPAELCRVHDDLQELLLLHQEALVRPLLDRELEPGRWEYLWSGVEACRAAGLGLS